MGGASWYVSREVILMSLQLLKMPKLKLGCILLGERHPGNRESFGEGCLDMYFANIMNVRIKKTLYFVGWAPRNFQYLGE